MFQKGLSETTRKLTHDNLLPGWNLKLLITKQELPLHHYHHHHYNLDDCSPRSHSCGPGCIPCYVIQIQRNYTQDFHLWSSCKPGLTQRSTLQFAPGGELMNCVRQPTCYICCFCTQWNCICAAWGYDYSRTGCTNYVHRLICPTEVSLSPL
jgi:hypothetical protein